MRKVRARRARYLVFALLLVAATLSVAGPASAGPASAGPSVTFGPTSDAAGTVNLAHVACFTEVNCVALGENDTGTAWYIVPIRYGKAKKAHLIVGANEMSGVACADQNHCVAVGDHVVSVVNGVAGAPQAAPLTSAVACPTLSVCYAVGEANVVTITNGTVTATSTTPNFTTLNAVSCIDGDTCLVLGANPLPQGVHIYNDAYAIMTDGVVGAASALKANQDSEIDNVYCFQFGHCFAGGSFEGETSEAVRLNVSAGVVTQSRVIDDTDFGTPEIDSAGCLKGNFCVYTAFNAILVSNRYGMLNFVGGANLPDGSVSGMSCPVSPKCIAVGEHPDVLHPGNDVGFVQSFSVT